MKTGNTIYDNTKKNRRGLQLVMAGLMIVSALVTIMGANLYYEYQYNLLDGEAACLAWGYDGYHGVAFSRLMALKDSSKPYPEGIWCGDYGDSLVMVSGRDQNGTKVE